MSRNYQTVANQLPVWFPTLMPAEAIGALQELQNWFYSKCNGNWEHSHGITIDTLDNPGWTVTIDLADMTITARPFASIRRLGDEKTWIQCEVRDQKFEGRGGPLMLEEILRVFLTWAAANN
jgi:hypothetical protein